MHTSDILSREVLETLVEAASCDILTVYLSDPESPFDRSGYVLIGAFGVAPEYAPYMRGPLKPESIPMFSAFDNQPTLAIEDVATHPGVIASSFHRAHGHRSMLRVSVRLARQSTSGRATPQRRATRAPLFLEVFANYREPTAPAELRAADLRLRELIARRNTTIEKQLRRILNPRSLATKFRRLDRIADRLAEECHVDAALRQVRQAVQDGFDRLGKFVLDTCGGLSPNRSVVSLHLAHFWGQDHGECDPTLIAAYPRKHERPIRRALWIEPERGICRHVATDRASVILNDVDAAPESWRAMHLRGPVHGMSITVPLFEGQRLLAILNVEAEQHEVNPLSMSMLWRVIPQIERLVRDLLGQSQRADALAVRDMLRNINTLPFAPRELAVWQRLEVVGKQLGADAVTYIEWDGGDAEQFRETWHRQQREPSGFPEIPFDVSQVRAMLETFSHHRVLSAQSFGPRITLSAYGIRAGRPRVARHAVDPRTIGWRNLNDPLGAQFSQPDVHEEIVLPLWHDKEGTRFVKAILVLRRAGATFAPTPILIENLDVLASCFAHAILSIVNVASRGALHDWAIAGMGPLHTLLHVADNAIADFDSCEGADADPQGPTRVRDSLKVLRQQIWLWYHLSHPTLRGLVAGDSMTTFGELVDTVVRQALILAGRTTPPVVEVTEQDRACPVVQGTESGITSVLSNALSNSMRWGLGIQSLRASIDVERGEASISVSNRAKRKVMEQHLREAVAIVKRVDQGHGREELERIAERRGTHGLRGLGTWIASRVTREMLGGRYSLQFDPDGTSSDELRVTATVTFPTRAVDRPRDDELDQMVAGAE